MFAFAGAMLALLSTIPILLCLGVLLVRVLGWMIQRWFPRDA